MFPEQIHLEMLIDRHARQLRVRDLGHVLAAKQKFPLLAVELGAQEKTAPTLGLFAGVHGLEKIGSEVVLAYLETCLQRAEWDPSMQWLLERTRLVFMPIVNPYGVAKATRSNARGVDLMRNAPLDADEQGGFLHRGHRLSPRLPWFRGQEGGDLEVEARAVYELTKETLWPADVSLALDVHSGFGLKDRLWFPYAYSKKPFANLAEVYALKKLFDRTLHHHVYDIEPVSSQYTIHGDLWDYIYMEHQKQKSTKLFIPWTLEMGSWAWLRKNPSLVFSRYSLFHPLRPHRRRRILRRHLPLFDFLHRALLAKSQWIQVPKEARENFKRDASELWYG